MAQKSTEKLLPVHAEQEAIVPYFFALHEDEKLAKVLQRPYQVFIEVASRPRLEQLLSYIRAERPDFALSISTGSAYRHNAALMLADYLIARFHVGADLAHRLSTCLQEAVSNAIIHGNLAIEGQFPSLEAFDEHYRLFDQRMNDRNYSMRHLRVALWAHESSFTLSVNDEGAGIDMPPDLPTSQLPHGRGLFFIQSMATRAWLSEDRRTLFMTFAH